MGNTACHVVVRSSSDWMPWRRWRSRIVTTISRLETPTLSLNAAFKSPTPVLFLPVDDLKMVLRPPRPAIGTIQQGGTFPITRLPIEEEERGLGQRTTIESFSQGCQGCQGGWNTLSSRVSNMEATLERLAEALEKGSQRREWGGSPSTISTAAVSQLVSQSVS